MISQGFANGFFVPQGFASFARFSQWAVCRCQGGGETGDEPRACPHSSSGGFGRPSRSVHPLLGLGSALTGNLDPGSSRAFSAIRKLSTGRWRTLMALAGAQGGHSRQATIVLICTDDTLPPLPASRWCPHCGGQWHTRGRELPLGPSNLARAGAVPVALMDAWRRPVARRRAAHSRCCSRRSCTLFPLGSQPARNAMC